MEDSRIARYSRGDIIAFLEDLYYIPETRQPIRLQEWQREYILKPLFNDLDELGRRKYTLALIGLPKKNGKSALAAGIGLNFIYADEQPGEVIIAANDIQQASVIIYTKIRQAISLNPALSQGVLPLKGGIEVRSSGTTCRCIAHHAESAAGLNPTLVLFDELWGFPGRKFYDELTTVPTRKSPLTVIVTYAGYKQEGLLWELYKDGIEGEPILDTGTPDIIINRGRNDPKMFFFWAYRNLASWVGREYLDTQRRRLPPEVYARLHENRWMPSGAQLFSEDDIRSLYTDWHIQVESGVSPAYRYIVATDLGLTHDRTARVVGHYNTNDGKVYIDNLRIWQGTPDSHIDVADVEADLMDCANRFSGAVFVIDPWQMEYVIQRLSKRLHIIPFNFQADVYALSQVFTNLVLSRRLVAYTDSILEEELRSAITRQTGRGWRLDHLPGRFNDAIMAIGMMCYEAIRAGRAPTGGLIAGEDHPLALEGIREKVF